ncbi:Sporulation domain-containing protein [Gemmatirosa kalamazoonensis]|uniref:Sporulation domain-containing protein n=1 Tax=Gemmatirosa kalamazoonensis TaxID=861299 RepID=W0RCC1_9BACT|nr:SPOR domain-containing protein [Gemmatirosa kalamazoonensis]AHG88441.1 Sporulation domain-containing protein [Gemmatirosa kalamazoonensis]
MRLPSVVVVALTLAATAVGAQPSRAPSSDNDNAVLFARARRLVTEGNGVLGRILVDSALASATPGTPAYAEALYWRATLAERASDAERDYRQIAVEYPQSPRATDALVRLAQLDLVRGQPAAARDHLTRLLRDHADAATQARAQYWLARAALDARDPRGACDALNEAAGAAEPGGDLARQVVALRARVPRCTLKVAVGSRDSGLGTRDSGTTPPRVPSPESRVPTAASRVPNGFSVQVAAYDTRGGADALAARLVKRGIEARVVSPAPDTPPFRVRVGHWATRAEAAAALRDLKAKGLVGYVADDVVPNASGRP